jgi:hypothetical protein
MSEIDGETRDTLLRLLRMACGGEMPRWLPDEAVDDELAATVADLDDAPPWQEDQMRRAAALLRPFVQRETAASGASG